MKGYLGVDFGRARIGFAISETGLMARPLTTIKNKGDKRNLTAIKEILTRYCGSINNRLPDIVVGLPLLADGNESSMVKEVRRFGEYLHQELGVDVIYHNEYLTSVEAEEYIREHNLKEKESVDAVAAFLILTSYLEDIKEKR